jgi:uncharacterized membrane protein YfcA
VEKITAGGVILKVNWKMSFAGAFAGAVNGLFGAGGGMVLVPILTANRELEETEVFPSSVSIILPICFVSLAMSSGNGLPITEALPYLIGSIGGGILAGLTGNRFKVTWLHRGLGILILWGGIRYLC